MVMGIPLCAGRQLLELLAGRGLQIVRMVVIMVQHMRRGGHM